MKILSIDPGSEQSAYLAWDGAKIGVKGIVPNADLRTMLMMLPATAYDIIAIEMIAHYGTGMPAGKTVFETCIWIGRFLERCPLEPRLVMRRDVKLHLCGSVRAKDGNVRQSLIDRLGAPGTKKEPGLTHGVSSHLWAALAIGVYTFDIQAL